MLPGEGKWRPAAGPLVRAAARTAGRRCAGEPARGAWRAGRSRLASAHDADVDRVSRAREPGAGGARHAGGDAHAELAVTRVEDDVPVRRAGQPLVEER